MPRFRARQILEWVYEKGVTDPSLMTSLSKADRDLLHSQVTFLSGEVLSHQLASDGTQKLLVQWADGTRRDEGTIIEPDRPTLLRVLQPAVNDTRRQTECVMIPTEDRRTACISSQVGCPVGCKFCASGMGGLDASLSAGRIVEQVYRLGRLPGVRRISNVVFMGMGEPLSNMQNVIAAIRTISALWGLGISARKITISTVGLPKAIEKLSEQLDLPVTLALSLHAPNDEIRRTLIPWAEFTTIEDLLAACRKWFEKTGREITLEYTLLRGVNDRPEHAEQLAGLARTLRANVNLIRYNEVRGTPFKRPETDDVRAFQQILTARHINTHIRASRGRDIAAACGQLRHEHAGV
jgi:23S rRNA (adenine2503-C2)-methyltransferase